VTYARFELFVTMKIEHAVILRSDVIRYKRFGGPCWPQHGSGSPDVRNVSYRIATQCH